MIIYVCTAFPYLGDGWTDCSELWYVVVGLKAMRFISTRSGEHCTYARAHHFSYLSNRWSFVMKFVVLLDTHQLCVVHRLSNICASARTAVHSFKHIYLLPLVHRPEGFLLVIA